MLPAELLHLLHRPGELHAAALAAAAGVDLRLDDHGQAEALRDGDGFVGIERDVAAGNRHAEPGEDRLYRVGGFSRDVSRDGPWSGDAPHGQRGPPFTPPRRVETEWTLGCYRAAAAALKRRPEPPRFSAAAQGGGRPNAVVTPRACAMAGN